jgi:hypothetical protein
MTGLIAVDAPHFYAGILFMNDKIFLAAPILRWAEGRTLQSFVDYCKRKKWKLTFVGAS